ncbi:cysteine hydrolase family protein [Lysinibacillus sp. NPDC097195]|uniref:cysteine hydrolase family protein n=1 Tax=Lysinibacillus sp. NPDC097195 TaxID=3364141 RepID=UPI00382597A9
MLKGVDNKLKKAALLVIDYTNDFVASDGKLTCGEPGQLLDAPITALIEQFIAEQHLVVFANDLHEENDPFHPETKLFPPHNIRGTLVDAYNLGISTVIYANAVASFDAAGHEWALRHFEHTLGAKVVK